MNTRKMENTMSLSMICRKKIRASARMVGARSKGDVLYWIMQTNRHAAKLIG